MKPTTHEVWDLDTLTYEYSEKYNIDPRKFGNTFMKEYVPEITNCKHVYNRNYVDICFDIKFKLDKSIVEFMELDVPLGESVVCVTFRL